MCSFCPFGGDFPGIHFSWRCLSIVEPPNAYKYYGVKRRKIPISVNEKNCTLFFCISVIDLTQSGNKNEHSVATTGLFSSS